MRKMLFFLAFCFCSLILTAQSNYKPGIVVRNNNDTLKGWINYENWRLNPRKVEFKSAPEDKSTVTYTVHEIQYFEIPGEDAYQRAAITKDMRPARVDQITIDTRDSVEADTAFLRILVKGSRLTLYELMDFKPHYYLQEPGAAPQELIFKLNAGAELGQVYEQATFKDQLKKYLAAGNSSSLERKIGYATYTSKDLSKIVFELNGGGNAKGATVGNGTMTGNGNGAVLMTGGARKKIKAEFFGSVGLEYSKLSFTGDHVIAAQDLHYTASSTPLFLVGMDILSARNLSDLTFRVELGYSQHTYKGDRNSVNQFLGYAQTETYTLGVKTFSPTLSALYNFRRSKKIKFYVGLGVAGNISSYSKNTYMLQSTQDPNLNDTTNNYLGVDKSWFSLYLRAGVRIGQKFEVGVTGNIVGRLATYMEYAAIPRTYSLRFAYFL